MPSNSTIKIERHIFFLAAAWTLAIIASFTWNALHDKENVFVLARSQANNVYEKDILYRRWASIHGGLYAPITDVTPPNPYLSHVEERDIVTPSGRRLTLINPAYMTRQVYELAAGHDDIQGHITSLNPIRPQNAPDAWETAALQSFQEGSLEAVAIELMFGKPFFRLMYPLLVEEPCLKCHAAQGYSLGDIRGGISVSVPMEPFNKLFRKTLVALSFVHILFWVLGLTGIFMGGLRIRNQIRERGRAEEETRKLEEQLQRSQKMEAIGTLAGGVAHDFNNILMAILGFTELTLDSMPPEDANRGNLTRVVNAAERARGIVQQILAFGRKQLQESFPVKMDLLVRETLKLVRASTPATIEIVEDIDPLSGSVLADPNQLRQVLIHLCANAGQAMIATGGSMKISLMDEHVEAASAKGIHGLDAGDYVKLTVDDNGPGMDDETLKRAFEPYFTTKDVGEGSGLGLAVVHGIVTGHGGVVTVENKPGGGCRFSLYFPKISPASEFKLEDSDAQYRGNERVLFVDDEPMLVKFGEKTLSMMGYDVTSAMDGKEALAKFKASPQSFDVVVADQTMFGMTGGELAKELLSLRPDLPIIIYTGHSDILNGKQAKEIGVREFLMKPLNGKKLGQAIRRVLEA